MSAQESQPVMRAMAGGSHGFLVRAYFRAKPYLPHGFRWVLRRLRAPILRRRSAGLWPIDYAAGEKPVDWKGWPEGKKFALLLTHDVESEWGISKARSLAELELSHGLRASFNFIPEGSYPDPVELREWLEQNGFEVGVHDLNHDGHLYESRASFSKKAKSINGYLNKWKAVGFRSGFMLRQLDWLHDLNVLYDASTFDTDPFEPQPQGSHTIFPFHVTPPADVAGPGYVELSYTLPQDSTLFLLLKEKTPVIWKQKLDWIARQGGLALVNIHPDYIDFSGNEEPSASCYPAALLKEFLDYIRLQHGETFWNPVPRDLALWFRDQAGAGSLPPDSMSPQPPPPTVS